MKIKKFLSNLEIIISGTAFVAFVLITCCNVISRFVFKNSFAWAEELTYLFFNWSVYFGVCILYEQQGLIAIDIIVDRLPAKAKHIVKSITFAMIFVMCVGLFFWGMQFSIEAWTRTTAILKIPYFFIDLSVPLASIIMAGYSVDFFVRSVRGEDIEETAVQDRA